MSWWQICQKWKHKIWRRTWTSFFLYVGVKVAMRKCHEDIKFTSKHIGLCSSVFWIVGGQRTERTWLNSRASRAENERERRERGEEGVFYWILQHVKGVTHFVVELTLKKLDDAPFLGKDGKRRTQNKTNLLPFAHKQLLLDESTFAIQSLLFCQSRRFYFNGTSRPKNRGKHENRRLKQKVTVRNRRFTDNRGTDSLRFQVASWSFFTDPQLANSNHVWYTTRRAGVENDHQARRTSKRGARHPVCICDAKFIAEEKEQITPTSKARKRLISLGNPIT